MLSDFPLIQSVIFRNLLCDLILETLFTWALPKLLHTYFSFYFFLHSSPYFYVVLYRLQIFVQIFEN